jgi:hypothetical protein
LEFPWHYQASIQEALPRVCVKALPREDQSLDPLASKLKIAQIHLLLTNLPSSERQGPLEQLMRAALMKSVGEQ